MFLDKDVQKRFDMKIESIIKNQALEDALDALKEIATETEAGSAGQITAGYAFKSIKKRLAPFEPKPKTIMPVDKKRNQKVAE